MSEFAPTVTPGVDSPFDYCWSEGVQSVPAVELRDVPTLSESDS